MLKKVVSFVICLVLLVAAAVPAFSDDRPIHVTIDGVPMTFTQEYGFPMELEDRVLVPVRQIFEQFGWQMTYIEEDRSILAGGEQGIMMLQIDNKLYHFPNKTVEFDVAPTLVGSRTLVPIRVITEAMGHEVDYDEDTRTVIITTKTEAPAEVEAPVDPVVTDDAETDAAQAE